MSTPDRTHGERPRRAPAQRGRTPAAPALQGIIGNHGMQRLARMPLEEFRQRVQAVPVSGRTYTYDQLLAHLLDRHLGNQVWLDDAIEHLPGDDVGVEQLVRHVIRDYRTAPDRGGARFGEMGLPMDDFSESESDPRPAEYFTAFADAVATPNAGALPELTGLNPARSGVLLHSRPSDEALTVIRDRNLRCLAVRTVGSDWLSSPTTLYLVVDPARIDLPRMTQDFATATEETGTAVYHRWLGRIVGYGSGEIERYVAAQEPAFTVALYDVTGGGEPPDDDD